MTAAPAAAEDARHPPQWGMLLAVLGVVYGDIGTSPLYAFKSSLILFRGIRVSDVEIMGILSLIFWALILIVTVKYVLLVMRADNRGEGGILALMALAQRVCVSPWMRGMVALVGIAGACLFFGDGVITPAISVLSAVEGLEISSPDLKDFVLPISVVVIVLLFAVQSRGTGSVGRVFGPIMAVWFVVIGALGAAQIAVHPYVLLALSPWYALKLVLIYKGMAFFVLGAVVLCVTGAEALYADMGHFGKRPIRLAWTALVLPSLVLNYAGQTGIVLDGAPTAGNIFFRLCPSMLLVPLVLLATVATVIASQSIITGAFSMTRQAIQLGWLPRLAITQTSAEGYGQIYVGPVNWLLMLVTLGLAIGFGKSDNLAAAYGIAVSATMLMTTVLLFIAMREIWHWPLPLAAAVAGLLALVDASFLVANMLKVLDGGYVPLLLAAVVYGVMLMWHRGAVAVSARLADSLMPIEALMQRIESGNIPRVPGTAVFLTRTERDAPPVLLWHLKHNRALHERLFILTVLTEPVPFVATSGRLTVAEVAPQIWRAQARYGFMERPDVPALLRRAHDRGCAVDLSDLTYFVGHETIVAREDGGGLPQWLEAGYAFLQRNSAHVTDYFRLPAETVVEIGREIAI